MFEVHEKLPFSQYVQLPGLNASGLKHALVSPLQYQHALLEPPEDSDTFRQGRAAHTAVLEPHTFLREYAEWQDEREDGTRRIRRGKEWDDFQSANAGKTILKPAQYQAACAIRDIVRDHPVAGPLVRGPGRNELSLKWKHKRTGADCKSRLDRIIASAIVDIKLTHDVSMRVFGATAARFKYHMQGAFYRDAAEACGFGRLPFKIVAIQDKAPHDVVVYDLGDDVLAQGQEEYERAIDIVLECRAKQQWPGQAVEHEIPLFLPAWAMESESALEPVDFGAEVIQ